jgi:hypothetical protein
MHMQHNSLHHPACTAGAHADTCSCCALPVMSHHAACCVLSAPMWREVDAQKLHRSCTVSGSATGALMQVLHCKLHHPACAADARVDRCSCLALLTMQVRAMLCWREREHAAAMVQMLHIDAQHAQRSRAAQADTSCCGSLLLSQASSRPQGPSVSRPEALVQMAPGLQLRLAPPRQGLAASEFAQYRMQLRVWRQLGRHRLSLQWREQRGQLDQVLQDGAALEGAPRTAKSAAGKLQ